VKRARWWLVPAVAAGALTFVALGIGIGLILSRKISEAANWVMAAGGLAIVMFSCVQLYREERRDDERIDAARAKLRPAARLARRECERAVIEAHGTRILKWLTRWYLFVRAQLDRGGGQPINILEERLRETVILAAEAGGDAVRAADAALGEFILAADIINDWAPLVSKVGLNDADPEYQAARAELHDAVLHLAAAGRALEALAPRGDGEPDVPSSPRFAT
jgi:hypothetical protein